MPAMNRTSSIIKKIAIAAYLGLLANGILWACDKLDADGKPKAGCEVSTHQH